MAGNFSSFFFAMLNSMNVLTRLVPLPFSVLKLIGIALNRSKNHIGERTTEKGVQVEIFFFY